MPSFTVPCILTIGQKTNRYSSFAVTLSNESRSKYYQFYLHHASFVRVGDMKQYEQYKTVKFSAERVHTRIKHYT